MEHLLAEAGVLLCLLDVRGLGELGAVGPGDEDRGLGGGDDHHGDIGHAVELVDDAGELGHGRRGELVDLLTRVIEPEDGQVFLTLDSECTKGWGRGLRVGRRSFGRGGHARFCSLSSSMPSSMYISPIWLLYFLSMTFRLTFNEGVISSSSMVKSRGTSEKRRIFSCRSRFLLKRSSSP